MCRKNWLLAGRLGRRRRCVERKYNKWGRNKINEEIEILREGKLRLLAEMENLRKRSEKDKIDSIKYGNINLARDILSLSDNLSRALDAVPKNENRSKG